MFIVCGFVSLQKVLITFQDFVVGLRAQVHVGYVLENISNLSLMLRLQLSLTLLFVHVRKAGAVYIFI